MSHSDRFALLFQLVLYILAIYMVIKAFGPAKPHSIEWHLDRNRLAIVGGQEDAAFVIKTRAAMTEKQFHALTKGFSQYFSHNKDA